MEFHAPIETGPPGGFPVNCFIVFIDDFTAVERKIKACSRFCPRNTFRISVLNIILYHTVRKKK